jgi:hypothetical protein
MGIEDGTDSGLTRLNKHMTTKKCTNGINVLRKLEIGFDYGFMLFQPLSTFISVNENLDFLRRLCGDGYTPLTFLKMMPYCATPVEKELRNRGRLKGIPGFYDYDFFEESLNHFYAFVRDSLNDWINGSDGLSNISKWARNYISVFSRYLELTPEVKLISRDLKRTVSESNSFLLDNLKELSTLFESGKYTNGDYDDLNIYRENINIRHNLYKDQINNSMSDLLEIAERQKILRSVSGFL